MTANELETAFEILSARVGQRIWQSEWFEITQDRINDFANVTMDHQWIHVDPKRARTGPYGTTIAHGQLTLAIMGHLPSPADEVAEAPKIVGQKARINYGFDKIRFPAPVPSGAKIRTTSTLKRVEIKGNMIEQMTELLVEIQGQDKPACVAESLGRIVF